MALIHSMMANSFSGSNDFGVIIEGGHNLCSAGSAQVSVPSSFNSTDPMLGSTADNGNPTPTVAAVFTVSLVLHSILWRTACRSAKMEKEAGRIASPALAFRYGNAPFVWQRTTGRVLRSVIGEGRRSTSRAGIAVPPSGND